MSQSFHIQLALKGTMDDLCFLTKNDFILQFLWIPNLNSYTGLEGVNYQLSLVKRWLSVKVWHFIVGSSVVI